MEKDMRVVVTGATGFIAKNLRKYLSDNDVKLISISRHDFKKVKNETKFITKNYDEKVIFSKLKNSDALIHLVGIGKQTIDNDYNQIHIELTKKIINLCKKSKIKKIIYFSGLGVSKNASLGYFISKYKAEKLIIDSKLNYTIFRPSYIVGKDDYFTKYLKKQIKTGQIQIPGSGNYSLQPIYIDDVTKIIFNALTQNNFSKMILDLVGSESITFQKYVKEFSRGTNTQIKKINLETVYHEAITNPTGEFGVDDLNLLIGDFKGDYKKLKDISKIEFSSILKLLKTGSLL
ncbi:MAG: NAD-dependent epimerase/dehydratase family protein [Nitrosarchaeum sp.]|jgi:nucleoside-diphosphate-sugar epimerase|uniref:NAD-dependent epimerase/dehydratase family protein n=1 Tax=Nitrosarchaeum sp. TaxID=2026886 RepID=UPI002DF71502|nr:NAD-dependent epimerase/dehydratase family protein [Nitrosarchaeum sp.]MEC4849269.1 NAD-dependent epimerase/dehydratase family protein [Nitrosarchaeum sp.]